MPAHHPSSQARASQARDDASTNGMTRRAALGAAMTSGAAMIAAPSIGLRPSTAAGIRIGLVGCGGRGVGAAVQAVAAGRDCLDGRVTIAAIGDLFVDALHDARGLLAARLGASFAPGRVPAFSGRDAFDRVIAEPIDAVILATPPGFRPSQIRASVDRGLHVYAERPLAVDAAGVEDVERSGRRAADRGLSFVTSLSLRYDAAIAATIDRFATGAGGRTRRIVASEPLPGWWARTDASWPSQDRRIRNWIADPALSGGLFLDRCFDAVDLGLALLGSRTAAGRAFATADAVEYRDDEGRGIRVDFSGSGPIGRLAAADAAGERAVVTPEMRRRASTAGFTAAWTTFLEGIRDGLPVNDSGEACRTNRVAIAMARASESLPGIARPLPAAWS